MTRRVKEFIDIRDHVSLDGLIERLAEIRELLPQECEAELRLRGDEVFGRRLSISFMRDMTPEEADCAARYEESAERKRRAA